MPRLLLVDGHSNLYRAFFAIRGLSAPDGMPTNAAYGFLRMLTKLLRDLDPTHVAVAFDAGAETFRTRMDERYKAHREPMPDDLAVQIPLTQDAVAKMGITVLAIDDVEADDVIGTLAVRAGAAGWDVVIVSSDKDLMQLVRDPNVRMWHTRRETLLDEAGVVEAFGVPPAKVIDVLALMGDSSDNVPGCPGIGEKGAKALIGTWGSLAAVLAHADEVTPTRSRNALAEHRDEVELSRELVTIRTDLDLPVELDDLAHGPEDRDGLAETYARLGFTSMLAELEAGEAAASSAVSASPVSADRITELLTGRGPVAVDWDGAALAIANADGVFVIEAAPAAVAGRLAKDVGAAWCFDAKTLLARLRDQGCPATAVPRDAMLAGYLLAPGERIDLATVASRAGVAVPGTDAGVAERAATTLALVPQLSGRLEAEGLERVFTTVELPLVPVLEEMERNGIRLDTTALDDLRGRLDTSIADLEREIWSEAGGEFNINSPQQLAEVMFQRRGLPVIRRTSKTRAPSTDADVLGELAGRGYRLPALIIDYREQTKLKSTYVDSLPRQVADDGRIHTRFNQTVAATGRLSSSDPNLQNIPVRTELGREVRRAFVADDGWALIAADYSQIELRVLAHFAEEDTLIDAFARGEDIHRTTAALVLGVKPADISDDQRRAAKTVNFGLIYGMSAFSLGRELGIETARAQEFIDAYFARLPRVRAYLDSVKDDARRTGKVTTLFGRVRWIAGLDARAPQQRGNAERQAINAPIQGTAADLMKLAMIRVHARTADVDTVRLLLQVHDELVLESPRADAHTVAESVRQDMQGVADLRVPLRVDVGIGPSWATAKG